ncbi:hypothetical protein ACLKA6_012678 [Drosophila palustris]
MQCANCSLPSCPQEVQKSETKSNEEADSICESSRGIIQHQQHLTQQPHSYGNDSEANSINNKDKSGGNNSGCSDIKNNRLQPE